MQNEILQALAAREEEVTIGGHKLLVREMQQAADVTGFKEADESNATYLMMVRCVFRADGTPAFTDADIPALRASSRKKFSELAKAVHRVNGLDNEQEVKNSSAAPSGAGSSS